MAQSDVLIVEDDRDIANLIRLTLSREGHEGRIACSGRQALASIEHQRPDLVILDIMLPDLDGLEVCRKIRREPATRSVPVLMVSARGEEADVIAGLELGADDYVTKPFSPRVLLARVNAVLRRRPDANPREIVLAGGALRIDAARHKVEAGGRIIDLTLTQYRMLHYLAQRPGFVRTRAQIVAAVRGEGTVLSGRAVDVHVAGLRQKLGEWGNVVETVRGVGYRVAADHAPTAAG